MTELDTLKRAKMYIDSLARGVDPVSGQLAEEDSVINNVRISRCLFYVSDVLEKVIDNGGKVGGSRKENNAHIPFRITSEQLARVLITPEPVGISEFSRRVAAVLDEGVRNIPVTHITAWLCENGYLIEETVNNHKRKVATAKGEGAGMITVDSTSRYGVPYKKIVYTEEAQRFILSRITEIEEDFN